jgi:hypothetical protein
MFLSEVFFQLTVIRKSATARKTRTISAVNSAAMFQRILFLVCCELAELTLVLLLDDVRENQVCFKRSFL